VSSLKDELSNVQADTDAISKQSAKNLTRIKSSHEVMYIDNGKMTCQVKFNLQIIKREMIKKLEEEYDVHFKLIQEKIEEESKERTVMEEKLIFKKRSMQIITEEIYDIECDLKSHVKWAREEAKAYETM